MERNRARHSPCGSRNVLRVGKCWAGRANRSSASGLPSRRRPMSAAKANPSPRSSPGLSKADLWSRNKPMRRLIIWPRISRRIGTCRLKSITKPRRYENAKEDVFRPFVLSAQMLIFPRLLEFCRQCPHGALELLRGGDFASVGQDPQALALVVSLPGLVPQDGQRPAVIGNVVEAEVFPVVGRQRVNFHRVVGAGRRPTRPVITRSQYVE